MWRDLASETKSACFPQLAKYLDFQNQAIEERDRKRAEREQDLARQRAEQEAQRAEEERKRAEREQELARQRAEKGRELQAQEAEEKRQAKLPANRLKTAYHNFSIVQLCHQQRAGNIYDSDLERARKVTKDIEKAAIAEDPTINPDKVFAEADTWARERLTKAGLGICEMVLIDLFNSSPGTAYPTQRP